MAPGTSAFLLNSNEMLIWSSTLVDAAIQETKLEPHTENGAPVDSELNSFVYAYYQVTRESPFIVCFSSSETTTSKTPVPAESETNGTTELAVLPTSDGMCIPTRISGAIAIAIAA
jgi:hypothetical protein